MKIEAAVSTKFTELHAIRHPPCACGAPWTQHDAGGACGDYRPVPSENCPDGVPVDLGVIASSEMGNLVNHGDES